MRCLKPAHWLLALGLLACLVRGAPGADKADGPGGAVIVDSAGRRFEISSSSRTRDSAAERAAKAAAALPKVELPLLDDPKADLSTRKWRAQTVLIASVLLAFGLVFWARRCKP